jgi:hypothetical protein
VVVTRDSRRLIAGKAMVDFYGNATEMPCTAFYVKDRRLEQMFPDLDAHTDYRRIGWLCLSLLTVRKN